MSNYYGRLPAAPEIGSLLKKCHIHDVFYGTEYCFRCFDDHMQEQLDKSPTAKFQAKQRLREERRQ